MENIKFGTNRFYVGESEDNRIAEIHFVLNGDKQIIIDHTEVSEQLKGTGMGKKLVEQMVLYARENDKQIIPLCPFAKSVIEKNKHWHDTLHG